MASARGRAFGPARAGSREWEAFPAAEFVLPRGVYRLDGETAALTWLDAAPDAPPPALVPRSLEMVIPPAERREPLTLPDWEALILAAQDAMRHGELEKVVLSRTRELDFPSPPPAETIFRRIATAYPHTFRFFFEPVPGHVFLGATPELLASAAEGRLRTVALAGSAPRGATPAEDARLGAALLDDPKNRREHAFVVRHILRSLRGLGLHPEHPAGPRLRTLPNIQHLETPVETALEGVTLLEAAAAFHPTPALAGTPRAAALDFIRRHEPHARGWYGAPVGWISPNGDGKLAVAIRSALMRGTTLRLYAGAGILPDSDPQAEWEETALKFRPLEEGVRGAELRS